MKTCDVQVSGAIELLYYGELSGLERLRIEEHVRSCADCRSALDELAVIRTALASRPDVATPPGGDWSGFMARLDGAIQRESPAAAAFQPTTTAAIARRSMAPYFAMAALLALVTMSVLFVARQSDRASGTSQPVPQIAGLPPGGAPATILSDTEPDPALAVLSEQHFERSKLVVLGLTTKNPADAVASDWAYERQLATSLLSDTRLYRRAAEERGMNTIAGVMRDLELVLLQTSMSDAPDARQLDQIQRLIRRRDLVTKMDVVNAGLIP